MSESKKLSYILKLLDDDSPVVRKSLVNELVAFGLSLHEELTRLNPPPTLWQRQQLQELMAEYHRRELRTVWPRWFEITDEYLRLEKALGLLSEFQTGLIYAACASGLLDELADEFRRAVKPQDAYELAQFLFKTKGLKGDQTDYYNPLNSSLVYVLKEKKGIPLSLSCIYMLVARRVGLTVEGCNLPGHFMAKTVFHGQTILVDCFNGGRFLDPREVLKVNVEVTAEIKQIIEKKTTVEAIILRYLNNLIRAFEGTHNLAGSQLMTELVRMIEEYWANKTQDTRTRDT